MANHDELRQAAKLIVESGDDPDPRKRADKDVVALWKSVLALLDENATLRAQNTVLLEGFDNVTLRPALERALRWMKRTYDYESLSPAGASILKDEIAAATKALGDAS